MLHWHMGQRIRREILNQQRASYGEEILPTLPAKLEPEYGKGFSVRNLARMIKFAEAFQGEQIVATLSRQLSWSHFVEILGQMEMYLRWLDKHDRAAGEESPIGLILCASANAERVELLNLNAANIRVAEYLAHIPGMKLLQQQLHRVAGLARACCPTYFAAPA